MFAPTIFLHLPKRHEALNPTTSQTLFLKPFANSNNNISLKAGGETRSVMNCKFGYLSIYKMLRSLMDPPTLLAGHGRVRRSSCFSKTRAVSLRPCPVAFCSDPWCSVCTVAKGNAQSDRWGNGAGGACSVTKGNAQRDWWRSGAVACAL